MSEVKTKVKSVKSNGTWESQHGKFFKFIYNFEDGVEGNAMHKEDKAFEVGTEVEYEVKNTTTYGKNIKVSLPKEEGEQFGKNPSEAKGGGNVGMMILAQSTYKNSVSLYENGALDKDVKSLVDGGKSEVDAVVSVLHVVTEKMMRSQLALVKELS